ncbi:MAG: dihydrodipicolinate synthase family protein [SAR202 cluster bacterium]|nr:dihydrodipicolinate synthase family protein [SAR202 cluster bacterium]
MSRTDRTNGRSPSTSKWRGVFAANPTPMDSSGGINQKALRAVLEDNILGGVHGFWVAGGTGEGAIFDDQERATVARVAGEVCAGKAFTIMHVGAATTASAVKGARAAREAGCDAICCVPPFFYRPTERSILEHYAAVADAADLPFFAYNLPQLTQVEITPQLMEKIQKAVPQLTGLKHSAVNFAYVRDFADMGLKVFTGSGRLLLPALTMGAIGVVDAPPSLAPGLYRELFDAWEKGDMPTALEKQKATRDIVDLVTMFGAASHIAKAVIGERIGIDCGEARPPVNRLNAEEKRAVMQRARELGLLKTPARFRSS